MCSAAASVPSPYEDRTARARIRDVGMVLFGEHGFRATTVRAIAESASVSPALVLHHFGSKQGLRDAIDGYLADEIRAGKFAALTGSMALDRNDYEAMARELEWALPYLTRALAEDDDVGRRLYERLHADVIDYLEAGVDAGILRPTDDPRARAAALLNASLGQLLLATHLQRVLDVHDRMEAMLAIAPPMLDLYTDGLFTDARFRNAWQADQNHDAEIADPAPHSADPAPHSDDTDVTDDDHG